MTLRLETERLILRPPQANDVEPWIAFAADERSKYIRSEDLSENRAWRVFAGVIGHWTLRGYGMFIFALKDAPDRALGAVGPWNPRGWPEKEIGWSVWSADAEGKGYVREAAEAVRTHVYRDLGWDGAVSYIDPRNARSIRLAERLGATPDWNAETPDGDPLIVFRHPSPEALA